jgi:hypothetical protein
VTKTEPPTVEAILKQAKAQALAEGSSLRAVLEAGVKDHPDEPQYYAAYSRFQVSAAGLEEHLHGAGARR